MNISVASHRILMWNSLRAIFRNTYICTGLTLIGGTRSRVRPISVSSACEHLSLEVCLTLLGLHSLTVCDSVTTFAAKGSEGEKDSIGNSKKKKNEGRRASEEDLRRIEEVRVRTTQ